MYSSHPPAKGAVFRNEDGAFDLPSILVGVVVVGILTAGVLATIFGIIPFAQDNGIKQDLSAVRTAQGVAKAKDGRFMSDAELRNAGYLAGEPTVAAASAPGTLAMERTASKKKVAAGASADGSCFISVGKSGTGKIFFLTDDDAEAKNLKTTDIPGCLTGDALKALLEAIGGFGPEFFPGAPGVSGSATGPTTVTFTWPATADATGYTVSYRINGGVWTEMPGEQAGTTAVVEAAKGDTVDVEVEAVNMAGESAPGTATVALPKPMGNVLSWGRNQSGMLGQGTINVNSYVAAAVKDLPGKASTLAAGIGQHQCAVVDGAAYCWGQNTYGQLGNNTAVDSAVPVKVIGLEGKTVTGIGVGTAHTCAVADGKAYCWGNSGLGQMGNGTTVAGSQLTATPVSTVSGLLLNKTVTAISVGGNHACVIADGKAYCWGRSFHGQIGYIYGSTTQQNVPAAVGTVNMTGTVTSISAGNQHTCAVAAGKAYCWGAFTAGQLGSAKTTNQWEPIAVTATAGVLGGKTVTSVSTGGNYSCAIANGAAYCWGSNGYGVLGTNNTTSTTVPVAVTGLTGTVTELSASSTNTCAIANDVPYCWGGGHNGSNGDGTTVTTQRNAPTQLAGITGPVAHISMGNLAGILSYK